MLSFSKYECMKVGVALSHLRELPERVDVGVNFEGAGVSLVDLEQDPFDVSEACIVSILDSLFLLLIFGVTVRPGWQTHWILCLSLKFIEPGGDLCKLVSTGQLGFCESLLIGL